MIYKGGDNSSTDEEIKEQGWTVPDYYFVVEYGGVESPQSKTLEAKNVIHIRLVDNRTNKILQNKKYTITLTDDSIVSGTTDDDGYIEKIYLKHFAKIKI